MGGPQAQTETFRTQPLQTRRHIWETCRLWETKHTLSMTTSLMCNGHHHPGEDRTQRPPIIQGLVELGTTPFAITALQHIIHNMKNNNAPGPGAIADDQTKHLDEHNQTILIGMISRWWDMGRTDEGLDIANIVLISIKAAQQPYRLQYHWYQQQDG